MKIDNLEDLKNLILRNENEQIEFKETTGQLERGMETYVPGGYDIGKVVGAA